MGEDAAKKDFAFADPVSYTVAVRHGKLRLYASLMWRSYTVPPNASSPCSADVRCPPILSNVSRVHYSVEGDGYDRVATVPTTSSAGENSLYSLQYTNNISIAICSYRCSSTGPTTFPLPSTLVGAHVV